MRTRLSDDTAYNTALSMLGNMKCCAHSEQQTSFSKLDRKDTAKGKVKHISTL